MKEREKDRTKLHGRAQRRSESNYKRVDSSAGSKAPGAAARNSNAPRSGGTAKDEVKIYGRHASRALWRHRPNDIVRVYLLENLVREFRDLLKWCADTKHAYHLVGEEDLNRVAASTHHEGICVLAKRRRLLTGSDLSAWAEREGALLVYLDGVGNPHNFGTVLRNAAHFGVDLIFGREGEIPSLSAAACRVAQGGAEFVPILVSSNPSADLKMLQNSGFAIICTSSHVKASLYRMKLPKKSVIVLGGERSGISRDVKKIADAEIQIPGSGNVDSLNIASASAVLFAEYSRQHGLGRST